MSTSVETSIMYSVDELHAAANLMGAPAFPGVPAAWGSLSREASAAVLVASRRTLLARGVVHITDDGTIDIPEPHRGLFDTALAPELMLVAERTTLSSKETRLFYLRPDRCVEQSVVFGHVYKLTSSSASDLMTNVAHFFALGADGDYDRADFTIPRTDWRRFLGEFSTGSEEAFQLLPEEASSFERALRSNFRWLAHLRGLASMNHRVVGRDLIWIDAGGSGRWLVEGTDEEKESKSDLSVRIRSVPVSTLGEQLLGCVGG